MNRRWRGIASTWSPLPSPIEAMSAQSRYRSGILASSETVASSTTPPAASSQAKFGAKYSAEGDWRAMFVSRSRRTRPAWCWCTSRRNYSALAGSSASPIHQDLPHCLRPPRQPRRRRLCLHRRQPQRQPRRRPQPRRQRLLRPQRLPRRRRRRRHRHLCPRPHRRPHPLRSLHLRLFQAEGGASGRTTTVPPETRSWKRLSQPPRGAMNARPYASPVHGQGTSPYQSNGMGSSGLSGSTRRTARKRRRSGTTSTTLSTSDGGR